MATVADKTFHRFFSEFKTYLNDNFGHPTEIEKTHIRHASKRVRRLDSLARLVIKDQTKTNCAAVGLINNTWYFTANNYHKIEQNLECIYDALSRVKFDDNGDVVGTKKARKYLIRNYISEVPGKNNRKRLTKDVRKFLSALKTHAVFTRVEISRLFKGYNISKIQKNFMRKSAYYWNAKISKLPSLWAYQSCVADSAPLVFMLLGKPIT